MTGEPTPKEAMTTANHIQAALVLLVPTDDDHWTEDGLPRMDAMKSLTGDGSLTRKAVTDAWPGFTRASRLAELQEVASTPDEEDEDLGPDEEQEPDLGDLEDDDEDEAPEELEEPEDILAVLDLPVGDVLNDWDLLQKAKAALVIKGNDLVAEKKRIEEEIRGIGIKGGYLDRAEALHVQRNPELGKTNHIRDYLEATKRARALRAERARRFLKAGTTAEDVREQLASSSKLDKAMSQRKAPLGAKRPAARALKG